MRVCDAQLLHPFETLHACALVVFDVDERRERALSGCHGLGVAEIACRAAHQCCEPVRGVQIRLDHRRRQHGLVDDVGVPLEHGRCDAAAHRMCEQHKRLVCRHRACDRPRAFREIGDIAVPCVDVHNLVVPHIARGIAMPAVFENTNGESGEQEVPCHLLVFGRELGESVRDEHGAMGLAGGAGNLQGMEFLDVVAHDMQLVRSAVRRVQRAQSVPMPIRDGRPM